MSKRLFFCSLALALSTSAWAADKIPVVNEGGIARQWTLAPGASLPVPAYPEIYKSSGAEVCVAIGYLLNADGTTSDFSLLKSWSSDESAQSQDGYWALFAQDASNALARWKFAPRPEVVEAKPVYTVATFLFGAKDVAQLRNQCSIPDLPYHLVELRNNKKVARRMVNDDLFSRLQVDPLLQQRYELQQRQQGEASRRLENPAPAARSSR
ncbi:hypothetical protein [Thermomonas sp.]|uniref:hypothetical protein n=1 Tax=Thermomonas sp. TaxID=1971895 RepID=UPI001DACC6A5|nr:hypothetical protein [Thermomonas sp.]MBZ0087103.1 energy transducer TonB [Thermomonas sp.]MCO5055240.1 energy transducer TonB [Thermomonas sp.]HRO62237.1 hypothetical protein [Thermomonas sp.]